MDEQTSSVAAIVLAAGKGTRMKSALPKVLHPLSGTPMIGHVIRSIKDVGIEKICAVIGGELAPLESYLANFGPITLTEQLARLGTGEAVACAAYGLKNVLLPGYAKGRHISGQKLDCSHVFICAGDTPALESSILSAFLAFCRDRKSRLAVLAMQHPQPFGYGRIVTDEKGLLQGIIEEKDASPREKEIGLCNSGVIYAESSHLFELLRDLQPENAQKEYYLTDCFQLSRKAGVPADVFTSDQYEAFDGINDRQQLAKLETRLQRRAKDRWMREGVTFRLPDTTYIEDSVVLGGDLDIGPNCSLLGRTRIGDGCKLGSHVLLKNVIIPAGTTVPPGTVRLQPE